MENIDLGELEKEIEKVEGLRPISIVISPLHILAAITLIQTLVLEKPEIADDRWAKIGIEAAQQLQNQFNQYPEICKLIETAWHPELLVTPETVAYRLLDIDAATQQNEACDKDGDAKPTETVAKRIARGLLKSQGYIDM